ncbi:hypothetical protein JCM5296_001256 [Sporobolomyces johnsonii]
MRGKIAIEEAWNLPRLANDAVGYASPAGAVKLEAAMQDIRGRIKEMDEQGVELQALWIAKECKGYEHRFANFAAVCMIDPAAAAKEARRCIKELGFVGVLINDYQSVSREEAPPYAESGFVDEPTLRIYFDAPEYDVFWRTMEELNRPVYLHPRLHRGDFFKKRPHLAASAHGFKTQLSSHVLAIATAGVFDRFPKLQLCIGHMGEGLVADLWRADHKLDRARFPNMTMQKGVLLKDYFRKNIHITSSGHYSTRTMLAAIAELGSDRIMFSIDYPYEPDLANACNWIDNAPLSEVDKLKICRTNAIRLLRLDEKPFNLNKDATYEDLTDKREGDVFGLGEY